MVMSLDMCTYSWYKLYEVWNCGSEKKRERHEKTKSWKSQVWGLSECFKSPGRPDLPGKTNGRCEVLPLAHSAASKPGGINKEGLRRVHSSPKCLGEIRGGSDLLPVTHTNNLGRRGIGTIGNNLVFIAGQINFEVVEISEEWYEVVERHKNSISRVSHASSMGFIRLVALKGKSKSSIIIPEFGENVGWLDYAGRISNFVEKEKNIRVDTQRGNRRELCTHSSNGGWAKRQSHCDG
ncbi:hypothetical protein HAX54_037355 [Datura stramonium]|uniref:Uncharacterized protein n=1 Tax=Datura stramonium TaxID=4076 RepID=A0ABS8RMM2_DATST|nr:hypothetical protein [Datura stramonium]